MSNRELRDQEFKVLEHLPAVAGLTVYLLLPLLLMPLAGDWGWPGAWALLIFNLVFGLGSRLMAMMRNPGILLERSRSLAAENTKAWDKLLVRIVAVVGPLAMFLVAGLDKRWQWSMASNPAAFVAGLVLTVMGSGLASWALIRNPFFSGTVRIQHERGHHVVDGGPYQWLRHPGYAGAVMSYLGFPLLLDSWWAYIPVGITSTILLVRTELEDRTLAEELAGYIEYQRRVQHRLLPFIW